MTSYRSRIYAEYASRFQDAPETFDVKAARKWGGPYRYYLRRWLPERRDARILDVACGGGKLLQFYLDCGYTKISGIDLSPEQIALARQVTKQVVQANILEYLEQHENTFDFISGLDIIEHFYKEEVLCFLDLCFAALKPGGRLVLQTPNAESPWGAHHRYNDFTHEVAFNPNSLSRMLRLVGFERIESRETGPVPYGHSIKSTLRYVLWQGIRLALYAWNVIETGSPQAGVFTRIFLISGIKPDIDSRS